MVLLKLQSPAEKLKVYVRIVRFTASLCGIDLFTDDFHLNWITYTLFASIAAYFIFVFLTIYKNFQDDWKIVLRVTVTFGSAFQGVSKLITLILKKKVVQDLLNLFLEIYKDYETMGDKYREALDAALHRTKTGVVILTPLYAIGSLGMASLPSIFTFITGERYLVLEFEVPGLDIHTDFGYYSTIAFQMALIAAYAFGLYCSDLGALIYLLQSHTFANIFAAKIEYFNEMLEDSENQNELRVDTALKDIIKWLQLYSDYTSRCNNLFYYVITVQIISAFGSTVLSIYLIMAGGWPGAYTYVVVAFSCLYLYCILGTENELANKKFEECIYALHWYKLNVQQQKIVLQVLVITQRPKIINIAGVAPLSVSTALSLTKTLYSIAMLMIQFLID